MGHTHKKELEEQCASIPNRVWKSMIDGGLGPRAPCSPINGEGVIPENHSIIFFIATREWLRARAIKKLRPKYQTASLRYKLPGHVVS